MSACFFSNSPFFGANLVCNSPAAFWPSLVVRMALCTWIVATLVGAGCAWAAKAMPRTIAGETKIFFKLEKLLIVKILPHSAASEGPANCKSEHRPLFKVRILLAEPNHRVNEGVVVGEAGS